MSLRSRILEDPYYRFQSGFELAVGAELGVRIDVNQATIDDWLRLPGISIHQARSLVNLSQAGVPFYSIADLAAALGMPVNRWEPLAPILSFQYYHEDLALPSVHLARASASELATIPGIDEELARSIVADRSQHGVFTDLVDFQRRLGLSGKSIGELMHYLKL
jgi:DNA uptake protein ComE-like DNA-binding protein